MPGHRPGDKRSTANSEKRNQNSMINEKEVYCVLRTMNKETIPSPQNPWLYAKIRKKCHSSPYCGGGGATIKSAQGTL